MRDGFSIIIILAIISLVSTLIRKAQFTKQQQQQDTRKPSGQQTQTTSKQQAAKPVERAFGEPLKPFGGLGTQEGISTMQPLSGDVKQREAMRPFGGGMGQNNPSMQPKAMSTLFQTEAADAHRMAMIEDSEMREDAQARARADADEQAFSLDFDTHSLLQAVVMSEVLKRRKAGAIRRLPANR